MVLVVLGKPESDDFCSPLIVTVAKNSLDQSARTPLLLRLVLAKTCSSASANISQDICRLPFDTGFCTTTGPSASQHGRVLCAFTFSSWETEKVRKITGRSCEQFCPKSVKKYCWARCVLSWLRREREDKTCEGKENNCCLFKDGYWACLDSLCFRDQIGSTGVRLRPRTEGFVDHNHSEDGLVMWKFIYGVFKNWGRTRCKCVLCTVPSGTVSQR